MAELGLSYTKKSESERKSVKAVADCDELKVHEIVISPANNQQQ